jgi:hypothetical protein
MTTLQVGDIVMTPREDGGDRYPEPMPVVYRVQRLDLGDVFIGTKPDGWWQDAWLFETIQRPTP